MAWFGLGKTQRGHTIRALMLVAFTLAIATKGRAQQASTDPAKPSTQSPPQSSAAPPASPSSATPQFYDSPKFTVSGVTDTTNIGGHGSDTVVRTRESLAKETATLGKNPEPTRDVAERERDRAQSLISQSPGRADLHHQLAMADEALGDSLAAVREYQRAAELDSIETYIFDWGAELLLHHAPEPALEVFTRGNQLFPKSERILLALGAAQYALGSIDESLARVRAASDLNPGDPAPYLFVGEMNRAEKIPRDAAVEMMQRFVTLHPEIAAANYGYAVALWKSRRALQRRC
jgi:tetratricopeptide (TPR) repeat protein